MNKSFAKLTKNIPHRLILEDKDKMSPRKLHCDKQG